MHEPYSFVGWIPCVNGHLDFGLIRPGIRGGLTKEEIKDKKISAISYSPIGQNDNHTRRIALQSWVNWQDERAIQLKYGLLDNSHRINIRLAMLDQILEHLNFDDINSFMLSSICQQDSGREL